MGHEHLEDRMRKHRPRLLFADTQPPDGIGHTSAHYQSEKRYFRGPWFWIFIEQLINSLIVGGIAGISALAANASPKIGIYAFALTFLIELRKYRQLPPS